MTPRGIRNNNPGNIRYVKGVTSTYQGCTGSDGAFCIFDTARNGIRAAGKLFLVYQDKYGLRTVRGVIDRWAPPVENNTSSYVTHVCKLMGVGPDDTLDLHRYTTLRSLVTAVITHENGIQPYTPQLIASGVGDALGFMVKGEEQQPEETAMPASDTILTGIGAVASALNPIAGMVFNAFAPEVKKRLATAIDKHASVPGLGDSVANTLETAIKQEAIAITGQPDADIAMVTVAKQPEAVAQIATKAEVAVQEKLAELTPFLDHIAQYDAQAVDLSIKSQDAADKRSSTPEGWKLRWAQMTHTQRTLSASLIGIVAMGMVQMIVERKSLAEGIMVLLTAVVMANVNTFRDIAGYLWGGVFKSGAGEEAREELRARRTGA